MLVPVLLGFLSLAGSGCVSTNPPAENSEPSPFYTLESGFHISVRDQEIRYVVSLEPKTPLDGTLYLTVHYENPATSDAPHTEFLEWLPNEPYLFLTSPPLQGLEGGKAYLVELLVFEDDERIEPIAVHEVRIHSNIDTRRHGR